MNMLVKCTLVVSVLVAPVLSFAQQANGPVTRAQVRADLIRVENAGYNPAVISDAHYPEQVLAAEAKVAAQDEQSARQSGMGGAPATTGESGTAHRNSPSSQADACVGPVSFCNIYFGG